MIFIMKTLSCRDAGFDCDYIIQGETEEDIFRDSGQHALDDHGIKKGRLYPEVQ